jgi:hypothetical protein
MDPDKSGKELTLPLGQTQSLLPQSLQIMGGWFTSGQEPSERAIRSAPSIYMISPFILLSLTPSEILFTGCFHMKEMCFQLP